MVSLRRLAGDPADEALVQRILERAPRYHHIIRGEPAGPLEARQLFRSAPPGFEHEDKHVLAILADDAPVGVAEVVCGYPRFDVAFVALMLLEEDSQRRGLGRAAAAAIEDLARTWQSRTLRLAVVESNAPAMAFWPRAGYTATGETKPHREGSVTCRLVLFEKQLGPVDLRPLTEADLALLCEWRARPHVAARWGNPPRLDELLEQHTPRTADELAFVITERGAPIGFAQACRCVSAEGGWWPSEPEDTWGIDLLIGEPSCLGRGLGSAAVELLATRLFVHHAAGKVIGDPSVTNPASIRCFARAGFTPTGAVKTPDGPAELMVLTRRAFEGVRTVRRFWTEVHLQRWPRARALLADSFEAHWPHTGERFSSPSAYIEMNATYPGQHTIRILEVTPTLDEIVSFVHVTSRNPDQECWATSRFRLVDGKLARLTEHWTDRQPAPEWRERFTG